MKYFYNVSVKMTCECCINSYIKEDNFKNCDKRSKNDFDNYYDGYCLDKDACQECNSLMIPETVESVKEYIVSKHLPNLGIYLDDKRFAIPTNTMELLALTLEGENENGLREAIILPLNKENYRKLYNRGKELWDAGCVSKYLICLLENDKCFNYSRPDKFNFEGYSTLRHYLGSGNEFEKIDNEELKIFNLFSTKDEILKRYEIDLIKNDFEERSNELER